MATLVISHPGNKNEFLTSATFFNTHTSGIDSALSNLNIFKSKSIRLIIPSLKFTTEIESMKKKKYSEILMNHQRLGSVVTLAANPTKRKVIGFFTPRPQTGTMLGYEKVASFYRSYLAKGGVYTHLEVYETACHPIPSYFDD